MNKFLLKLLSYSLIAFLSYIMIFGNFANYCYALTANDEPISTSVSVSGNEVVSGITKPMSRIWTTIIKVVQVAAFAGIIFVGIRYMFLSADKKSDIKQSLIIVIIGIILIFGAEPLVKIIYKIVDQLFN